MIIDCHTHITYGRFAEFSTELGRKPFTVRTLLKRMDMEGIDKSLLLPITTPAAAEYYAVAGNQECVAAARRYPDRLMTFCSIDPRNMLDTPKANLSALMRVYKDAGCLGIGEMTAHLPILDPRMQNMFRHAGECDMPILFHCTAKRRGSYGFVDRIHLPGMEQTLKQHSRTVLIGHSPAFWAEIDGGVTARTRDGYAKMPIRKRGRLWYLLEKYPNLYGDLSAGSGYNAISRDPEVGYAFLQKFSRKLMYGSDRFTRADEPPPPQLKYIKDARKDGKITRAAYEDIMHRTFERVVRRKGQGA